MEKLVSKRHVFYFKILKPIVHLFRFKYHFKYEKFHIKKNENYLILSNHQTAIDPMFLALSFNRPLYMVANDTLFNNSVASKLLVHCFGPIKKKKATVDTGCILRCAKIAKQGGNIVLFPEGNRTWADTQINIERSICKFIRLINAPVLFYNFRGGFGVDPRWAGKIRKGKFTGVIKEVIKPEDYAKMSDEQLYETVKNGIRVSDSESGELYKSKAKAEYLERMFFVCPRCGKVSSLVSTHNHITCKNCGLVVEYTEDLKLVSRYKSFKFNTLSEWYNYQLSYLKQKEYFPKRRIYSESGITIICMKGRRRIFKDYGNLVLKPETISVGDIRIKLEDICSATVIGGTKLVLNTNTRYFIIKGDERFNALKYVLTFNKLKTGIQGEKYYGLES